LVEAIAVVVWATESRLQMCEVQLDQSISYRPRDRFDTRKSPALSQEPAVSKGIGESKPGTALFDSRVYLEMDRSQAAFAPGRSMGMDRIDRRLAQLAAAAQRKATDRRGR